LQALEDKLLAENAPRASTSDNDETDDDSTSDISSLSADDDILNDMKDTTAGDAKAGEDFK
jgi:hypothetical protein